MVIALQYKRYNKGDTPDTINIPLTLYFPEHHMGIFSIMFYLKKRKGIHPSKKLTLTGLKERM